ncbi:MAG: L,D-transpeptidase family protein [Erythrobacter sp.]
MRKSYSLLVTGVVGAAFGASGALAQDAIDTAASRATQETAVPIEGSGPPQAGARFDEAFPQMVSEPVVQGDLEEPGPLVQEWTQQQVRQLVGFIESIGAEGLDPADYSGAELATLVDRGASDELNVLASQNFVWLVEDLRDGRTPMSAREQWFVVDPDRDRYRTADLLSKALESRDIAGTLATLHPAHPDYAKLRDKLAATPESNSAERKLIRANMDRWRWLARDLGKQYLITNVPEYQLRLTVNDKIISTYRTIVGKPGRTATPQLAETVEGIVFNPTWTVPQSIVVGEGLGERVIGDPGWASANGYKGTKGANGYITVVQQPGPGNSLGRMKLEMPNPHAIFFHDTPSRHLFDKDKRALSHGCIRTERAMELAITMAILGKGASRDEAVEIATSGEYTKVMVEREMPAYITYFTMATDIDGEMRTFEDIYGRDAPVLASLDQPREDDRSNAIDDEVIVIENDPRGEA